MLFSNERFHFFKSIIFVDQQMSDDDFYELNADKIIQIFSPVHSEAMAFYAKFVLFCSLKNRNHSTFSDKETSLMVADENDEEKLSQQTAAPSTSSSVERTLFSFCL